MADINSTVLDIQRESEKKLRRRMNFLKKKYEGVLEKDLPRDIKNEIVSIQKLLIAFQEPDKEEIPERVKITNSDQEEWYYQMMRLWVNDHAEVLNGFRKDTRATVYRFALHFFVEEIVLNPKNNALSVAALRDKLLKMTEVRDRDLNKIVNQLSGIENVVSYIAALETADAETNPRFGQDFQGFMKDIVKTEIDPESSLSNALEIYSENRKSDLTNNKKMSTAEKMGRES